MGKYWILFAGLALITVLVPIASGDTVASPKIEELAAAIASAEGFGIPDAIPTRANNPGDIKLPGDAGHGNIDGKTIFASVSAGWSALYHMIGGWISGSSSVYSLADTFREIGRKYVVGPLAVANQQSNDWASNVANALGVDVDSTLGDWYNS